jgi:hypothetical protein
LDEFREARARRVHRLRGGRFRPDEVVVRARSNRFCAIFKSPCTLSIVSALPYIDKSSLRRVEGTIQHDALAGT